jgi:hypothetical protein
MLPTVTPNNTIAGKNPIGEWTNASHAIATPWASASPAATATIGSRPITCPPTSRATIDASANTSVAKAAASALVRSSASFTMCCMPPTCEPSTSTYPAMPNA